MTATVGANLGMNYAWASGEDGWNTGMDSNLLKLDSLVQPNVIDSTINTPPGSPTIGDKYIVATGGSGAWNGLDAKIVIWSGSAWVSYTAKEGWMTYDQTNSYYLKCTGSAWMQNPFGIERQSVTFSTALLAPMARETGSVEMATAFGILAITTNHPARVRLYDTAAHCAADASRLVGRYPEDNAGCLFEFVTTPSMLSSPIPRAVNGFNNEYPVTTSIAYVVENNDIIDRSITTTFTFMPEE